MKRNRFYIFAENNPNSVYDEKNIILSIIVQPIDRM